MAPTSVPLSTPLQPGPPVDSSLSTSQRSSVAGPVTIRAAGVNRETTPPERSDGGLSVRGVTLGASVSRSAVTALVSKGAKERGPLVGSRPRGAEPLAGVFVRFRDAHRG